MREAGVEIPAVGTNYRDLPKDQWSVSQKIRHAKREEFEALSRKGGYRVCVDMAFHDLMVEKARASLVQQVPVISVVSDSTLISWLMYDSPRVFYPSASLCI